MYGYEWTDRNGIYKLSIESKIAREIRPVFKEELDYFGFNEHWQYPDAEAPILWAEGIRRYVLNGECVAEAVGGGFYTKPEIKLYKDNLTLQPIDIEDLWRENERLMLGLEKTAINAIRKYYDKYSAQGMKFAVAFSGGKDSLVLLDLVSRALSPDEFYVIFSDTGMELSTTYKAIEQAKKHWSSLKFYVAKSHLSPQESWEEFGPPGRRMRWCCAVHKSVPTILLLRELTGNYNVKAVIFDGVRAEESAQRASYDEIAFGEKNINQINCHPILHWSTSELFLYIIHYKLLFNDAYRKGLFRVGCTVCPMASSWWDGITNNLYKQELQPLLSKVEKMAQHAKPASEVHNYVEQGGWKARMGGNILENGGKKVFEITGDNTISFLFTSKHQNWIDVAPLLGPIIVNNHGRGIQIIANQEYRFSISKKLPYKVSYYPYSRMDRYIIGYLRGVANKTAYCIGCKTCSVQCPTGAFNIDAKGKIFIRSENCIHCHNCITFTNKGCLVAKSLDLTGGKTMDLKGMDRYKHFGFRRVWLEGFFKDKTNYFAMGEIGTKQYDSLKTWLRDADFLSSANRGEKIGNVTPLFEKVENFESGNPLLWAIIWTNLAYNSVISKWYMLNVPTGDVYDKNELVFQLGDEYSKSTRDNAVTALLETFRHSPIGSVLKQGIPIAKGNTFKFSKQGWNTPDAVAILYALYKWAEATGRYDFTLRQLEEARGNADALGVDPVVIFGINPSNFKNILQDISIHYDKYIRTTFVADLDNVKLFQKYKSIDILDLIQR